MVYDPNTNRLIVFAGQSGGGSGGDTFPDVWVLTNANGLGGPPAWIQLTFSGTIAAGQYAPSATYDAANNIMTVFGGTTQMSTDTNGVWTLSNANGLGGTPTWNQLNISGAKPSPRTFHTAVYNPSSNRMVIFGGNNPSTVLSDLWILNNANGMGPSSWVQIQGSFGTFGSPIGRNSHTAAYDAVNDVMMMLGGSGATLDGYFVLPWTLEHATGQ